MRPAWDFDYGIRSMLFVGVVFVVIAMGVEVVQAARTAAPPAAPAVIGQANVMNITPADCGAAYCVLPKEGLFRMVAVIEAFAIENNELKEKLKTLEGRK